MPPAVVYFMSFFIDHPVRAKRQLTTISVKDTEREEHVQKNIWVSNGTRPKDNKSLKGQ